MNSTLGSVVPLAMFYHKRPLSYSGDHAVSRLREEIMSGSSVLMLESILTSTQVVMVEYSWLSMLSSSSSLWRSWCWNPLDLYSGDHLHQHPYHHHHDHHLHLDYQSCAFVYIDDGVIVLIMAVQTSMQCTQCIPRTFEHNCLFPKYNCCHYEGCGWTSTVSMTSPSTGCWFSI